MPLLLLALFIGVPILEIAILIEVGGWIGLWPTIGLIVLTAVVGTALLRQQGLAALARAQDNLDRGVLPVKEVFDGLCLMAGGALLLTPGFVTDAVGFALLLPPLRALEGRLAAALPPAYASWRRQRDAALAAAGAPRQHVEAILALLAECPGGPGLAPA